MKLILLFVQLFCLTNAHWWRKRWNKCRHADFNPGQWFQQLQDLSAAFRAVDGAVVHCEMTGLDREWPHVDPTTTSAAPDDQAVLLGSGRKRWWNRGWWKSPSARFTMSKAQSEDNFQAYFGWKGDEEKYMCFEDSSVDVKLSVTGDVVYSGTATSTDPNDYYADIKLKQKTVDGQDIDMDLRCKAELKLDRETDTCVAKNLSCRGSYMYKDHYKRWRPDELRETPIDDVKERFAMTCYTTPEKIQWSDAPECPLIETSEAATPEPTADAQDENEAAAVP